MSLINQQTHTIRRIIVEEMKCNTINSNNNSGRKKNHPHAVRVQWCSVDLWKQRKISNSNYNSQWSLSRQWAFKLSWITQRSVQMLQIIKISNNKLMNSKMNFTNWRAPLNRERDHKVDLKRIRAVRESLITRLLAFRTQIVIMNLKVHIWIFKMNLLECCHRQLSLQILTSSKNNKIMITLFTSKAITNQQ